MVSAGTESWSDSVAGVSGDMLGELTASTWTGLGAPLVLTKRCFCLSSKTCCSESFARISRPGECLTSEEWGLGESFANIFSISDCPTEVTWLECSNFCF